MKMKKFGFLLLFIFMIGTAGEPYSSVIHMKVSEAEIEALLQPERSIVVDFVHTNDSYVTIIKRDLDGIAANILRLEKRAPNGSLLANVSLEYSSWIMDPALEGGLDNAIVAVTPMNDYYLVADIIGTPANLTGSIPDDPFYIDFNILIVKLNSSLHPLWSWVMGGDSMESVRDIAVDNNGNLYIYGMTTSYNFPITGNESQSGIDWRNRENFFLSKLTMEGNLSWSMVLSGDIPIGMTLVDNTVVISGFSETENLVEKGDQSWNEGWTYNLLVSNFSLDGELLHTEFVFQDPFFASTPNSWFSTGSMEMLDDGSFVIATDVYVMNIEQYMEINNLYSYIISDTYPSEPFLRMITRVDNNITPIWVSGFVGEKSTYYNHMLDVTEFNGSVAVTMYEPLYNTSYIALLDIANGSIQQVGNSSGQFLQTTEYNGSLYVVGNSGMTGLLGRITNLPEPQLIKQNHEQMGITSATSKDKASSTISTSNTATVVTLPVLMALIIQKRRDR